MLIFFQKLFVSVSIYVLILCRFCFSYPWGIYCPSSLTLLMFGPFLVTFLSIGGNCFFSCSSEKNSVKKVSANESKQIIASRLYVLFVCFFLARENIFENFKWVSLAAQRLLCLECIYIMCALASAPTVENMFGYSAQQKKRSLFEEGE